jgi:hypothetical protein
VYECRALLDSISMLQTKIVAKVGGVRIKVVAKVGEASF